jgi:guanyl-specific ribonuclease Sa
MRKTTTQAGFGHIVVLLVIVLVFSAVGYIGYTVYSRQSSNDDGATATIKSSAVVASTPTAPQIKQASDIDQATAALDKIDPGSANEADLSTLDSQLNAF